MTKITPTDISNEWGGSVSGTTYLFWNQSIASGSIQHHIEYAEKYIRYLVGESTWTSTDTVTSNNVYLLSLNYSLFRIAVMLSGGVITQGFDYTVGPLDTRRSQSQTTFYRQLIETYRSTAWDILSALQAFVLYNDTDQPSYSETQTPVM